MSDCLPCKEIIDNGFVAVAAEVLADSVGQAHDLYKPAVKLATAASAYVAAANHAIDTLLLDPVGPEDAATWAGCHRATEIMAWVLDANGRLDSVDAASKMQQWRTEILSHTAELVSGTQGEHAHGEG